MSLAAHRISGYDPNVRKSSRATDSAIAVNVAGAARLPGSFDICVPQNTRSRIAAAGEPNQIGALEMSEDREEAEAQRPVAQEQTHASKRAEDVEDLDVSEAEAQSIVGGLGGPGKGR
jgi:hypothetical protein